MLSGGGRVKFLGRCHPLAQLAVATQTALAVCNFGNQVCKYRNQEGPFVYKQQPISRNGGVARFMAWPLLRLAFLVGGGWYPPNRFQTTSLIKGSGDHEKMSQPGAQQPPRPAIQPRTTPVFLRRFHPGKTIRQGSSGPDGHGPASGFWITTNHLRNMA